MLQPPASTPISDDRDGRVPHPLVLAIREGHGGRDGDRVTGVDSHGVHVLDRAYDHDVVPAVAHHFQLELLPTQHAALDERGVHRRERERALDQLFEFGTVVGDAAPRAAQRERWPQDRRVPRLVHDRERFRHRPRRVPQRRGEADAAHGGAELGAVFGHLDGAGVGPDQLHPMTLERAVARQRHRHVQRRLAAHRGREGVRPLAFDHLAHPLRRHGLDVGAIGELGVGHDRVRVRVHQDDRVAFFLEGLHRLRAGIVELRRLPDHDRARPDQQDPMEISSLGHRARPAARRPASSAASTRSPRAAWSRPRPGGRCPHAASVRDRPLGSAARRRDRRV